MRVIPVPSEIRDQDWVQGTRVYAAPDGDLTSESIPPAEGVIYYAHAEGTDEIWPCISVFVLLEESDVEMIKDGARHLMMGWPGQTMPVFMVPEVVKIDSA